MALLGSAGESSAAGCSYSNVKACTNTTICKNATMPAGNVRKWKPFKSVHKTEAKRRGLNCDIVGASVEAKGFLLHLY